MENVCLIYLVMFVLGSARGAKACVLVAMSRREEFFFGQNELYFNFSFMDAVHVKFHFRSVEALESWCHYFKISPTFISCNVCISVYSYIWCMKGVLSLVEIKIGIPCSIEISLPSHFERCKRSGNHIIRYKIT